MTKVIKCLKCLKLRYSIDLIKTNKTDRRETVFINPAFPDERAGSIDSDKDNFIDGDGWDNFFRLKFKYLLPKKISRSR